MIDAKQRETLVPGAMVALAALILAGTAAFEAPARAPAGGDARSHAQTRRRMLDEASRTSKAAARTEQAVAPGLRIGSQETITAEVLAQVTREATRHGLKLASFRPERIRRLEGAVEVPFSAHLAGTYAGVRDTLSALDARRSRVAVRSIQIASADEATSAVTATVDLSALVPAASAAWADREEGESHD
jgi:Tfp pilus assembly protein PilO